MTPRRDLLSYARESVPLASDVVAETADRLGAPPREGAVGWASWIEEAAGLLCVRMARGDEDHERHPPCVPCRRVTTAYLRHLYRGRRRGE